MSKVVTPDPKSGPRFGGQETFTKPCETSSTKSILGRETHCPHVWSQYQLHSMERGNVSLFGE